MAFAITIQADSSPIEAILKQLGSFDSLKAQLFDEIGAGLTGDKVVMTLWRVKFSPDTEFDLIHEDFGSYSIEGEALADISKANNAELSVFGHIERFTVAA